MYSREGEKGGKGEGRKKKGGERSLRVPMLMARKKKGIVGKRGEKKKLPVP